MASNSGRDKAVTQERILASATALFVERGYEKTTVLDIAQGAGLSRATVFWHFSDKGSVFREAFSRMLAPFRESLNRSWEEVAPDKRLEEQLALSETFAEEHGHEIVAFVRWALESPQLREMTVTTLLDLNQRFAGALTQTVARLLPEDREPQLLAQALMLAFDANLLLSIFDQRPRAIEERRASVHALAALINRDAARG